MAYVDLNPIRARMAKTPETSIHTSIHRRLSMLNSGKTESSNLESFVGITEDSIGIPFKLEDYMELVDWSGRIIRDDKRGYIQNSLPPILARLGLNVDAWRILTTEFENRFQCWVGSEQIVRKACENNGYQKMPSTRSHRSLLS